MTETKSGKWWLVAIAVALSTLDTQASAETIRGKVTDASGEAIEGVMISAFDEDRKLSTSVFSQRDGSFIIDGLRDTVFQVRARLMGRLDEWEEEVEGGGADLKFTLKPATGEELEIQRTAGQRVQYAQMGQPEG